MQSNPEISLATIELAAKKHSDHRDTVKSLVQVLNDQVEAIKRAALPDIKRAVGRAADSENQLRCYITAAAHLFIKPRTVIFWGIKCGWEKGKGKLVFEDADRVVALIKKVLPEMAEALLIVKEAPNKKALAEISAADLKRLGITIADADDHVVVRAVDSDIDKIVTALLKEATDTVPEAS
jgi:hypothetical protein